MRVESPEFGRTVSGIKGLEPTNRGEAEGVLEAVIIEGSSYRGRKVSKSLLEREGLAPFARFQHRCQVEADRQIVKLKQNIWISRPLLISRDSGRLAFLAYVEYSEGKGKWFDPQIYLRPYIQSLSSGTWRLLPYWDYYKGYRGLHYGKGFDEESLALPFDLQKALSEVAARTKPLRTKESLGIVLGSTRFMPWGVDGYFSKTPDQLRNRRVAYFDDTNPHPIKINHYSFDAYQNPEIVMSKEVDFTKLVSTWKSRNSLYGNIRTEVFASQDGRFLFSFNSDDLGRTWIGSVQENTIWDSSTGLNMEWVYAGVLAMPAYEYKSLSFGYGNEQKKKGHYVDMFDKYISRIPLIRMYTESRAVQGLTNSES